MRRECAGYVTSDGQLFCPVYGGARTLHDFHGMEHGAEIRAILAWKGLG